MMKHLLIIGLMFLAGSARSESPEQFYDEANKAYQQGNFPVAIDKYEQILHSGFMDGELFYNLGNAYYKAGNVSRAILNYERALKLMPNDEDLRHNLALANLMIADKIEPAPRLFIWDWWDSIKASFSLNGITWLSYGLYVLLIASAVVILLAPSYSLRRAGFIAAIFSGICLVSALTIFVGKLNAVQSTNTAVVTTTITTIKNSPDPKSSDAFVLHGGVKVFITDRVNDWLKIRLADGKVGWMEKQAAEII